MTDFDNYDLAIVDVETTGLDPRTHHVWEIAVIRRTLWGGQFTDTREHLWQVRPDLTTADPKGLEVGRYAERFAVPDGWDAAEFDADGNLIARLRMHEFLHDLQDALHHTVMVGSNPGFDDRFLRDLLHAHGRKATWHYRPVCVATLAAGYLYGRATEQAERDNDPDRLRKVDLLLGWPWKSYNASEAIGVPRPDTDAAHTALGDARWAAAAWDQVLGGGAR
jgi:hypothetical protein